MKVCTWAPTVFSGSQVVNQGATTHAPQGQMLTNLVKGYIERIESLGVTHLLIPQRWWGNAKEIEASSLDCLAMTSYIAAISQTLKLVTAIHPGFFQPSSIAKWGSTMSQLSQGRWAINVTSGWNLEEFHMYGIDPLEHDERYERSREFIDVLTGAWDEEAFNYQGKYYSVQNLALEPRPVGDLEIYQGGQSDAAIDMAVNCSDWMFLNGGSVEKISTIADKVRAAAESNGKTPPGFAVFGIPLCRESDDEAWQEIDSMIAAVDPDLLEARKNRVAGAEGMWATPDELGMLDTNEGYSTRLIGSPDAILEQVHRFREAGVEMFHLTLGDKLFEDKVLPEILRL